MKIKVGVAGRQPDKGAEKPKKKRRRKRVKSEIRRLQKTTELLNSKASFRREVRAVLNEFGPGMRITSSAIAALQESSEAALIEMLQASNVIATKCAGRAGPLIKDMQAALSIGMPHLKSKF